MAEQTFSEVQAAAARIIVGQARGILPEYPKEASATQVLVVQYLLEQVESLLPE